MRLSRIAITEDYKSMAAEYIAQGNDPLIVQRYIDDFKQIIKYKQIQDPIAGLAYIPIDKRKNIDAYEYFEHLETIVDYVKGQVDTQGKTNFKNLKIDAKPIYEDQYLEIYYADSPQACVTYKGSVPYGWCIARRDSSNMFNAYRYKQHEPAFYFVKNKAKTNAEFSAWDALKLAGKAIAQGSLKFKDKYHFFVIQVINTANTNDTTRQQYYVTSALNDGDKEMSWQQITRIEPLLKNLQNVFEPKPLTEQERQFYKKYQSGISDEDFIKLPYHEKDMYINVFVNLNNKLTDEQFQNLPIDLKNKYIGFGVGLSENQLKILDNKLEKRYVDVTLQKIQKMLDESLDLPLTPTEIDIFIANKDKFDWDKLTDYHVKLLACKGNIWLDTRKVGNTDNGSFNVRFGAAKDRALAKTERDWAIDMAELILQNKKELTSSNVFQLLLYTTNIQKMARLLGTKNISQLTFSHINNLLYFLPKNKRQEMLMTLQKYHQEDISGFATR